MPCLLCMRPLLKEKSTRLSKVYCSKLELSEDDEIFTLWVSAIFNAVLSRLTSSDIQAIPHDVGSNRYLLNRIKLYNIKTQNSVGPQSRSSWFPPASPVPGGRETADLPPRCGGTSRLARLWSFADCWSSWGIYVNQTQLIAINSYRFTLFGKFLELATHAQNYRKLHIYCALNDLVYTYTYMEPKEIEFSF